MSGILLRSFVTHLTFIVIVAWMPIALRAAQVAPAPSQRTVPCAAPAGFEVMRVAGPPLVERPLFATFDDQGRLYVLDSGGVNGNDRGTKPPDVIRLLADTDGDGVFDTSHVFADSIVFGTGLLWYDGAIYLTSPPSLWKLQDTDGDGKADERRTLVTGFAFNQSCSDDLHGACLGPDGRIYFLPGRFPHEARTPDGRLLRKGVGPWLMRCRPDGSDIEFVSGCVGNPVEVDFLPSGELFAQGTYWAKPTMGGGLRDAVVHVVDGGEYSVRDRDYTDRVRTGDLLPSLVPMSATAPSGCMIYRSNVFGDDYQGDLFGSYFNTGKILRHRLRRQGATFAAQTEDFLVSVAPDVHFTDVLEDADGSMLAVDTGGWFRRCCPTSQIAKPEILGSIYRVRKLNAKTSEDPRGLQLNFADATATQLVDWLADHRSAVRERATEALRRMAQTNNGAIETVVGALRSQLSHSSTAASHRNAIVWSLCRLDSDAARSAIRAELNTADTEVRLAAIHAVALHRDEAAAETLRTMLDDSNYAVRREAANAIGRLADQRAVPALLAALADTEAKSAPDNPPASAMLPATLIAAPSGPDVFLDHAIVLALIRIGDADATRKGLNANSVRVQRGALIALDQMSGDRIHAAEVMRLAASPDRDVQRAAASILQRHADWADVAASLVNDWLSHGELPEDRAATLTDVVRQFREAPSMRQQLHLQLLQLSSVKDASRDERLDGLLRALRASGITDAPDSWSTTLAELTLHSAPNIQEAALQAIEALHLTKTAKLLRARSAQPDDTPALQVALIRTQAALGQSLDTEQLEQLRSRLGTHAPLAERLAAWEAIELARPSTAFVTKLLDNVAVATPVELPYMLRVFATNSDPLLGAELVAALQAIDIPIHPDLLARTLKGYPDSVHQQAAALVVKQQELASQQAERIHQAQTAISRVHGDAARGRALFFGKASCSLCHQVQGQGAKIGPDLSTIGTIRNARDLVEAVLVPSASFARGYEPVTLTLNDGRVMSGLMGRENAAEVILIGVQEGKPVELRFNRADIDDADLGHVSLMPEGLERSLTSVELADLFSFLTSLRQ